MQLKIIRNEKEYDETLNRIDELIELNPDPIEAIKYRMEEMNLKQKIIFKLIPYQF